MEVIPQQDYCPVEPEQSESKPTTPKSATLTPESANPAQPSQEAESNRPMGVVPPNMPNQAQVSDKAEKPSKTSPWLFILVMILLAVSSGLGYLIVSGNTEVLNLIREFFPF